MLNRSPVSGFTMVELMVGITILAIVIALGLPSFTTYLQGSKLASAAQSYVTGMQLARAEAIHRNAQVEFILTDVPVETPNVQNLAGLANPNGRNWLVRVFNPTTAAFDFIAAKSALEGSYTSTGIPSITIAGVAAAPLVFDGTLTFNGFGATTGNGTYQFDLQNPPGGACAPAGPMRCPRIRVTPGGQAHLCDPLAALGDSRAC